MSLELKLIDFYMWIDVRYYIMSIILFYRLGRNFVVIAKDVKNQCNVRPTFDSYSIRHLNLYICYV